MYEKFKDFFNKTLPLGDCFDVIERQVVIGGREGRLYFIDGLTESENMQRVLTYLMLVQPKDMKGIVTSKEFIATHLPFLDALTAEPETAILRLFSGLVPLIVEDLDEIIIIDARSYPSRSVEEPAKEKSLRGAKDGFTENFMQNVALIRRRLRDPDLIFKAFSIGSLSKTDVAIAYIRGKADSALVKKISDDLKELEVENLTVCDQTLLEVLNRHADRFNPFPKVRYTQRPDIISAHLAEGKIAIIVDNSPTVMLIPVGVFDFLQDVDDYYFPQLTGNYFRFLRIINFLVILFLTPVYLLIVENLPALGFEFFVPEEDFAIPIFWQFLLLEIAVDALKLASLNTPESLGMSLSVIGALILGEFSVTSGWFIPQTILCMAVVALAAFTQPSIELSYAVKFTRIIMLIAVATLGIYGLPAAGVLCLAIMAKTKPFRGILTFTRFIPLSGLH